VIYVSLRFSAVLARLLRPAGTEVVTRIAGLLLAAIAIQLVADAVASFVRGYTG
jgi:multiple antibiotic resistance protein